MPFRSEHPTEISVYLFFHLYTHLALVPGILHTCHLYCVVLKHHTLLTILHSDISTSHLPVCRFILVICIHTWPSFLTFYVPVVFSLTMLFRSTMHCHPYTSEILAPHIYLSVYLLIFFSSAYTPGRCSWHSPYLLYLVALST